MSELLFFYLAYLFSLLATTLLHEFGHAAASQALGGRPVMHHVYVVHGALAPRRRAIVAASGPFTSLLQGLGFLLLLDASVSSVWGLVVLWLALLGLANFFGYLITTPFWDKGDFGKISQLLGWSRKRRYLLFGIGLLAMPGLTYIAAHQFSLTARHFSLSEGDIYLHMVVLPWLFGCIASALMARPAPIAHVLSYPFFSGLFLLPTYWRLAGTGETLGKALATSDLLLLCLVTAAVGLLFLKLRAGWPPARAKHERADLT
jgi:hypothetical protein